MIMRLFNRRHSRHSPVLPLLGFVKNLIDRQGRRLANWLSLRGERLTPRTKRWTLIIFSILFSTGCIYSIIDALTISRSMVNISQVSIPKHVTITDSSENINLPHLLTNREYVRLKGFIAHLDSMRQTKLGSATYDSLCQVRRGFMDSIHFVINVFEEQLKMK